MGTCAVAPASVILCGARRLDPASLLAQQGESFVRLLVEDVTLRNTDTPWGIDVSIRWKTGAVSRHRAQRVLPHPQTTTPEVVARIEELYRDKTDREVAEILQAEGHRSGYGKVFTAKRVTHIRSRRGMKKRRKRRPIP